MLMSRKAGRRCRQRSFQNQGLPPRASVHRHSQQLPAAADGRAEQRVAVLARAFANAAAARVAPL